MSSLRFAWRGLRRDWRAGELRILIFALIIAVASLTSVSFFTDRVHRAMQNQAAELLAADLVVLSSLPIAKAWTEQAHALGLASAEVMTFPSVALAGDRTQLVEVKAVGSNYPLRGSLKVTDLPYGEESVAHGVPLPGKVWLDPRAAVELRVQPGARLQVGALTASLDRILSYEPDRGGDLFSIAPRLLMNLADVPRTELLGPGSRVSYRLLVAGEADALRAFRVWMEARLPAQARVLDVRDARPELRLALERAERFLRLAALVSVVIAGVAVATSARRYAARHLDGAAVMRCLGATQGFLVRMHLTQLLYLGLAASFLGALLGYAAQAGLAWLLAGLLVDQLPPPSLFPWLTGVATGALALIGFALPPILRLREVPPARVLRRDLGPMPARTVTVYGAALASMAALVFWQVEDVKLASHVLIGAVLAVLVLVAVAKLMVRSLSVLRARVGVAWRYGFANIARRAQASVAQVVAFGLGIMVLLLLSLVRSDLLSAWQQSLPDDAPNQFVINIQPEQVEAVKAFFAQRGLPSSELYPMVRGRLVAINGQPVTPEDYADDRARRHLQRELNLSWMARLPSDNRILAGQWWKGETHGSAEISIEQSLADPLNLKLGDALTFRMADRELELRISSLRKVEWDSFRANFFVVAPPGVLEDYPATYITSFHIDPAQRGVLSELVRQFPNLTLIDVDAIMTKVRDIMDKVNLSIRYVFLFTLLAGLAVLYAAIQATHDERLYEGALLRTLGASRTRVMQGLAAEFVALGLLAGLLAAIGASLTAYLLAQRVFQLDYAFNPWIWWLGMGGGALGVGLFGLWGTRFVLSRPPLAVLRQT